MMKVCPTVLCIFLKGGGDSLLHYMYVSFVFFSTSEKNCARPSTRTPHCLSELDSLIHFLLGKR